MLITLHFYMQVYFTKFPLKCQIMSIIILSNNLSISSILFYQITTKKYKLEFINSNLYF